jgi:inner membrane protein
MRFDRFDRGAAWWPALAAHPPVQELATFSHGFVKLQRVGDAVHVTDLRMGQEPNHVFSFPIARVAPDGTVTPVPATVNEGRRGDARAGLRWIGQRIVGNPLPPPR